MLGKKQKSFEWAQAMGYWRIFRCPIFVNKSILLLIVQAEKELHSCDRPFH
jgi:hypothetical protein